jgi:predicted DNA-binding ArsR family transcriptional regulator
MDINFEQIALMVLSTVITASQATIDQKVDEAADKIIAAVKDSETKLDDTAAKAGMAALERLAARVKAGL